jgi:hypothetical protein
VRDRTTSLGVTFVARAGMLSLLRLLSCDRAMRLRGRSRACACAQRTGLFGRGQSCSIATRRFAENLQMSGIARASLSNGKKSASVLELARTRGPAPELILAVEKRVRTGVCSSDWKPRTGNFATRPYNSRFRFKFCARTSGHLRRHGRREDLGPQRRRNSALRAWARRARSHQCRAGAAVVRHGAERSAMRSSA